MTDDGMALLELIEKSADADPMREMLGFAAGRLMEAEVPARTGAAHGERDPARLAQRNGYRARAWDTRVGRIGLEIPRLRRGSYFPSFLEPRRAAEEALTAVIREAYIQGVSTRAPSTTWSGRWAARACPGARSAAWSRRSTTG